MALALLQLFAYINGCQVRIKLYALDVGSLLDSLGSDITATTAGLFIVIPAALEKLSKHHWPLTQGSLIEYVIRATTN